MTHIVGRIPQDELKEFFSILSTIGAYIVFPSKKIDNKMTINVARGINHEIQDRFDLSLECIRRFYLKQNSPLSDPLERYSQFFYIFDDFKEYVDFFFFKTWLKKITHQSNFGTHLIVLIILLYQKMSKNIRHIKQT